MLIFIDLDGTLTNTASTIYKPFKDGVEQLDVLKVPLIDGAIQFIKDLLSQGQKLVIVSDSHTKYVDKIAKEIFNIPAISLCDKPNVEKILHSINSDAELIRLFDDKNSCMLIGDSWLDIELGRKLGIRTILTQFYKIDKVDVRDGLGQDWKYKKAGATYYANTFYKVAEILKNPLQNLLTLEAIFHGVDTDKAVKFHYTMRSQGFWAFRCLARQEDGECDPFARADMYKQIDNIARTPEFLAKLARACSNYLNTACNSSDHHWDFLTYVSDKRTTSPPNKMKEIFDLVECKIKKVKIFEWSDSVVGSLRNNPNYKTRREFIGKYLKINTSVDLKDKNIIVIDDQFTSSATAHEICTQLEKVGVKNILFVALFYLTSHIDSKGCPDCGKPLKIKIKKSDGKKFYSCVSSIYGGNGCGKIINIS
ncbi:MAG: hypothetical protein EOO44_11140 [Flavobacterium sp.]|nr:MAG: hypothetical protein EOO44_11140 [Flavobacterium sp.]